MCSLKQANISNSDDTTTNQRANVVVKRVELGPGRPALKSALNSEDDWVTLDQPFSISLNCLPSVQSVSPVNI